MEDRLDKKVKINKNNRNINEQLARPSNAILPPDLFNDVYDEVRLNGGSARNLYKEPFSATSD